MGAGAKSLSLLRNATSVLEVDGVRILIDPMLGAKGTLLPFSFFRAFPRRNPIVGLPDNASTLLKKVDLALVTHCQRGHKDHLDRSGTRFLKQNGLTTLCHPRDFAYLEARGIRARPVTDEWSTIEGLRIRTTPAHHGHGIIGMMMGHGSGFLLETRDRLKIYIMGDSVLTPDIEQLIADEKPGLIVINAGCARLDVGDPILMELGEIEKLVESNEARVIAVHLEALNHCTLTRPALRTRFQERIRGGSFFVPEDGETVEL
jgi:L-ascorbate metabolism protein UlaG (beta-lactamase superfamily)